MTTRMKKFASELRGMRKLDLKGTQSAYDNLRDIGDLRRPMTSGTALRQIEKAVVYWIHASTEPKM